MLSGMGADARVFAKQVEEIPTMAVPEWIPPHKQESLKSYAARLAERTDPGVPCFVGGASFGGFIALEMVRHLDVKACLLVGSVRSPDEFPARLTALRRIAAASDHVPFEVASLLSKAALLSSGSLTAPHVTEVLKQLRDSDASFLRWACRAVLEWEGAEDPGDTPVYHIHGQRDPVLPVKNTHPDVVVPGAGHALSMSHPDEVTRFIREKTGMLD
jgi:pimeloyl-ACP methyl ester carboxylesterase